MEYLSSLYAPIFASVLLIALPALTFALMHRAGIRGMKLGLAAAPMFFMFFGGFVSQWLMTLPIRGETILYLSMAKSISFSIAAISPLVILAMLKWPAVDNAQSRVETFQ